MSAISEDWAGPGLLPGQAGAVLIDRAHFNVVDVDIHIAAIEVACVGQYELVAFECQGSIVVEWWLNSAGCCCKGRWRCGLSSCRCRPSRCLCHRTCLDSLSAAGLKFAFSTTSSIGAAASGFEALGLLCGGFLYCTTSM